MPQKLSDFQGVVLYGADPTSLKPVPLPIGVGGLQLGSTNFTDTFNIRLLDLVSPTGLNHVAATGSGFFNILSGGFGTGTLALNGAAASGASITSTAMHEFMLPPTYKAGEAVTLTIGARETVGAATVATTLSVEAYKVTDGAAGANIAGAPSITDIIPAQQLSTCAITPTGLAPGDRLVVFVRLVCNDTGGTVGTIAQLNRLSYTIGTFR